MKGGTAKTPRWRKELATKMHTMHKKKKLQEKRKFVGLEWHAALSAMWTWIGGHPDTRMNSRIRVSADPPDRQMPVSAACVSSLKILCFLCIFVANYPESALIGVNLRFLSLLCVSASPCRQCGSHLRVRLLSSCFVHPWSSWRLGGSIPLSPLVLLCLWLKIHRN